MHQALVYLTLTVLTLVMPPLPRPAAKLPCLAFPADTIYVNGTIETLDRRFSSGDAMALLGGRVLAVGPRALILTLRGCGTRVIDLGGRTILPGFVDAHTHAFASTFWGVPPPPTEDEALAMLRTTQAAQLSVGITTQAEALASLSLVDRLRALGSDLAIRTTVYLRRTGNCIDVFDDPDGLAPIRDADVSPRVPGIKIFADGASNNPCGYEPATTFSVAGHDPEPFFGDLLFDQSTMDGLIQAADASGWQILVHSIGDRSRDEVLASYATVLAGDGRNPLRHRIEHNNFIRPEQIAAFRGYGILPVVFGYQFTCSINAGLDATVDSLPDKSWYQPYRTMFAAGLPLAWHGDWTAAQVVPDGDDSRSTWMGGVLSSLTTRREYVGDEVCEPQPWAAAETITIQQALRMISRNAAYAIGMEHVVGSLEPGKYADLVIVDADPLTVPADELHEMKVLVTVVGGKPRWCASSAGALCM